MDTLHGQARLARVAVDVGLAAVFGATLAITAGAIVTSWGGGYWVFDCVAGAVVCLIALARRVHRTWTAVAGLGLAAVAIVVAQVADLPSEPGPAMALALAVLVGSAIRALPPPSAGIVAALGFGVVVGSWLAASGGSAITVTAVTQINAVAWSVGLSTGLALRLLDTRRDAVTEEVRRNERLELARELHDVAAHHITGVVLQAQAAQIVARKQPGDVTGSLSRIEAASADALAAMRRIVGLLRDGEDTDPATPGPELLGDLVKRFDGHGPAVHLQLPDGEAAWPPEVTSTVYRVVQESLTNVARHAAHARTVTITVTQDTDAVTVEILDDASSGPTRFNHRGGYGLIGMGERIERLGGTLSVGPRPDAGWFVVATLPLSAQGPR